MNIQQALRKAAEIRARISVLESRIQSDILVAVGEQPRYTIEEFDSMASELEKCRFELQAVKESIDNANHMVGEDGESVQSLMNLRTTLSDRLAFRTSLRQAEGDRYGLREGTRKFERRIGDAVLDRHIDEMVAERRRIDDRICAKNALISVKPGAGE